MVFEFSVVLFEYCGFNKRSIFLTFFFFYTIVIVLLLFKVLLKEYDIHSVLWYKNTMVLPYDNITVTVPWNGAKSGC